MVDYGQLVIGPPGSGKTTYCQGMGQMLHALKRPHIFVNLDFANDWGLVKQGAAENFKKPDIDVVDLISLEDVMRDHGLGPNGGLLYCQNHLAKNVSWLKDKIRQKKKEMNLKHAYLLFDMPGQVELYTLQPSLREIVAELSDRDNGVRFVAVHLMDSTLCVQPHHYVSALMVSLTAQMSLEVPFLNVFSKTDLLLSKEMDIKLKFPFEYYARADELDYLCTGAHPSLVSEFSDKNTRFIEKEREFAKLHSTVCELVEDFSLTSFLPLDIQDKDSVLSVLSVIDQANGYALSAYIPSMLRYPGVDPGGDERRLPVDRNKNIFGNLWFEKFE